MYPVVTIFGKEIGMYAICALIGAFSCAILGIKEGNKRGIDENDFTIILLMIAVGVFVGSHLLYGITNIKFLIKVITHFNKIKSFKMFKYLVIYIFGGSVFYGGLIGGFIAFLITLKVMKLKIKPFTDLFAFMIPIVHGFGRIGCFFAGCCYGIESKFGFVFHNSPVVSANGVRRLPVQLFEAAFLFVLATVLYILERKGKCKNYLIYFYCIFYGIWRFVIEYFRGDSYRGFLFGLSTSQIISIVLFTIGVIGLILTYKNNFKDVRRKNDKRTRN